jgi:hypothetical protein
MTSHNHRERIIKLPNYQYQCQPIYYLDANHHVLFHTVIHEVFGQYRLFYMINLIVI